MRSVAILGAGYIAEKAHIPAWRKLGDTVKIAAICDLDLGRAQALAESLGVPAAYNDLAAMLSDVRPEFVDVCTPPHSHADAVITALMGAAHVLVEKPLALTVEECQRIIDTEKVSGEEVSESFTRSSSTRQSWMPEGALPRERSEKSQG